VYAHPDTKKFLEQEAGKRRMDVSAYCLKMIARGMALDEMDKALEEIRNLTHGEVQRRMLREVLATRYMVELQAKGAIKIAQTIGTDANTYADKELEKLWPMDAE
jgi:hypothetical protein